MPDATGVTVTPTSGVARLVSVGSGGRVAVGVAVPPLPLFFPFLSEFPFELPPPLLGFPFLPFGDFDLPPLEAEADDESLESLCEKASFGRNPIEVVSKTVRRNVSALWTISA